MIRHVRCLGWSMVGAGLGLAWTAWAQDGLPSPPADVPPWLTDLLRGAGLPTVLGVLGWWARGAMSAGVPIVVQLHPDDRKLADRLTRRLAVAVEDPPTSPGAPVRRRSDSDSDGV